MNASLEALEDRRLLSTVATGYPITTGTPLQKVTFNEPEVLRFLQVANTPGVGRTLQVFYNDEHALALGLSRVTCLGVPTDYATTPYPGSPPAGGVTPLTGAPYYTPAQLGDDPATITPLQLAIDQCKKAPGPSGGSDVSGRPLFPSLFVTDITNNVNAKDGDWQSGGTPIAPHRLFGSWKYFTETVTNTAVTLTGASDPAKNNWVLGAGSDTPSVGFAALKNEGYGAELRWTINDLGIQTGHAYRFYVQDHDGDQNKSGGDSGHAAFNFGNPALPTSANNVEVSGTGKLNDTASLIGSINPTGTVTFYLFAPGVTPDATLSNNVYNDTITLNGSANPVLNTATMGNHPGGYDPTSGGVYQWVVTYSGDASNNAALSPFGDEPAIAADASIALAPLIATNEVNAHHVITATVKATPQDGGDLAPYWGAPVTFTTSGGTLTFFDSNFDGDNNPRTCTTDGNGECTIEFTSSTAGTVTVNASTTISVLGLNVTRDTNPSTSNVPAGPGGTGPATKNFVDASVALAPLLATNDVRQTHTVTATVKKNTGSGFVAAPNSAVVFSVASTKPSCLTLLDANTDGDNNALTGTTNAIGTTTVSFTSSCAAVVTVNATATVSAGGLTVVRDTDPSTPTTAGPGGTGPATKIFVDGNIVLSPLFDVNPLNAPHTITATVKKDANGSGLVAAANVQVVFSVTDNTGCIVYTDPNGDGDNNVFTATTNAAGQATINFTSSCIGSVIVNGSATYNVGGIIITRDTDPLTSTSAGPGGSGPATKLFEDLRTQVSDANVIIGTGVRMKDTATLAGATNPRGTLSFKLFAPDDGPGGNVTTVIYTETVSVNGNGSYTTPIGFLPQSSASVPNPAGQWHWSVSYSGDANNPPISAESNPGDETVDVARNGTSITTQISGTVTAGTGAKLNDTAKLSVDNPPGINPKGTITFTLADPSGTIVYTDVVTLTGALAFPANVNTATMGNNPGGYAPIGVGTYQWSAVYSGDGNNEDSASEAGSEPVTPLLPPCNEDLYPLANGTSLERVDFNESEVLRFFQIGNGRLQVYYNDEHALALGVSKVTVNGVTTDYTANTRVYPGTPPAGGLQLGNGVGVGSPYYTASELGDNPATVSPLNLAIHEGTQAPGSPGGSDVSGRPLFPALFVTDITNNLNARDGDWQVGGDPISPSAVFGTWKYFTETITNTSSSLSGSSDPAKNNWTLGAGSDTPSVGFAALKNEGYGAEIVWNLADLGLLPGHAYRFYVQDHDGDQNKSGGDSGQGCINAGADQTGAGANSTDSASGSSDALAVSSGSTLLGSVSGSSLLSGLFGDAPILSDAEDVLA